MLATNEIIISITLSIYHLLSKLDGGMTAKSI